MDLATLAWLPQAAQENYGKFSNMQIDSPPTSFAIRDR